ncbi:MAG: hypothetical protein PUG67_09005 [Peptoniphilaceae bacterium]|nr:hypothetical protein [Peptoniphilaceae bacterium]MDY6018540.1 hypothetical protein [Anaerococcus sp.]
MKYLKTTFWLVLIVIFAIFSINYFNNKKEDNNKKSLYNATSGKKVELIDKPDYYDESDILTLLDKKTLELNSGKDENSFCKIVFRSDDGDFDGEFLDKKDGTEIYSNFKGKFEAIEKLDKFTYKLIVSEIKLRDRGFSKLDKDQDQLIYVFPNHFRLKNEFILRLPNTKTYNLIDAYEKYDFQNIATDRLNVFTLETNGYVYYEKVDIK